MSSAVDLDRLQAETRSPNPSRVAIPTQVEGMSPGHGIHFRIGKVYRRIESRALVIENYRHK